MRLDAELQLSETTLPTLLDGLHKHLYVSLEFNQIGGGKTISDVVSGFSGVRIPL